MFRRFERLVDPFEGEGLPGPVTGVRDFIMGFVRPIWPLLLAVAVLSAGVAATEVMVLRFLGELINWLAELL